MPRADAYTGKKPGEVKMVRNGDSVEAHQASLLSLHVMFRAIVAAADGGMC